ncbi:MAG: C10 family peptidase [Candidatus Stahlbacteria bacterium]|nr:C10 family peptidase [Candidatus Stahlbacteria bacterium]
MKKLFFFVTLLMITSLRLFLGELFAAPVSVETAKRVAENWYFERGKVDREVISTNDYCVERYEKGVLFYIFNFNPYILKSSQEVKQSWDRLNIGSAEFISQENIQSVPPLLTTTWNQDAPYWNQCPMISGQHCYVGCAALSTAQVMRYYRYPAQGSGSHAYYDPGCGQNLSADFTTSYDWANMPNTLMGANATQIDATAKLLFHIGVSLDMQYGTGSSTGSPTKIPTSLETYFLYDTSAIRVIKSSYTDAVWENMMRTELDSSRPMVYYGYTGGGGGHAFNMDGYQGTNYFHFNWGWGGSYDGYYYLTALTPNGYNFTYDQRAIIKIKPCGGAQVPDIVVSPDTLIFTYDSGKKVLSPSKANTDTLIYDDGDPCSGSYWGAGKRMAARMSPTRSCQVMAVQVFSVRTGQQDYKIGIYDWTGSVPGNQLMETPTVSSSGEGWNTTDISSYNINVDEDFIASFNMIDAYAALGCDTTGNGRAWNYNGSAWSTWTGTYFIRSIVAYGSRYDTVRTLSVKNEGSANLNVSNITSSQPWIVSVTPTSFNLTPGNSQDITITVTRNGLIDSTYYGSLNIASNDVDENPFIEPIKFVVISVAVEETVVGQTFRFATYPNPVSSGAYIRYTVSKTTNVSLILYDIAGRTIRTLVSGTQEPGNYRISWDGRDAKGKQMSAGIYFCTLKTSRNKEIKKIVFLK